jgi:hypothetical protein
MIKVRSYNADIEILESWPVKDKSKSIEIFDEKNKRCIEIVLGKNPKLTVFRYEQGTVLDELKEL